MAARLEEIAAEAGVSYHTLYAWGRGRRNASSRHLMRLAEVVRHRAAMLTDLAQELEVQAERVGVRAGESAADRRIGDRPGTTEGDEPRRGFGGGHRDFSSVDNGARRGW
ncbi:MAG TPA: helix-turn-helix transcriptional regulator [Longimicrobiales bacterium]